MSIAYRLGLAALAMLAFPPAFAESRDLTAGPLVIQHPWTRATPQGARVAGGYVTIANKGTAPDRLVGGSLAAAQTFEVHRMSNDGGVMTMRPAGPLVIPAGGTLTLEPSATHIMFAGLTRGLRKGELVDGTLVFEHAGTVAVRFAVEAIGARGPARDEAAGHAGHAMRGMGMD